MKKGIITLVVALLSITAVAQNNITKLDIQGCVVSLIEAKWFSYRIDDKHNRLIDVVLKDDKLTVKRNKDNSTAVDNNTRLPITLYITNIEELYLSDSQLEYSGSFGSKNLRLDVSASSDIVLNELNIKKLNINTSSNARLALQGKVSGIEVDASSSSKCDIRVIANTIRLNASSSAFIDIAGKSKLLIAGASSSANVNARHLQAKQVNSSHSSGGNIALAQLSAVKL